MTKHIHIAAILSVALIVFAPCTQARAQGAGPGLLERWDTDVDALDAYAQSDRLSNIRQTLKLSAQQERLWGPVEEALISIQENRRALRSALTDGEPTDQIERLRRRAELATQRADALKKLADAVQPLWATLSDEQKRELTRGFAMARTDQDRRMFYRRDDDDAGMHHRDQRRAWRYDDQDRADRDRRDSDDGESRYRYRDRMMGRRGSDDSDDRDDVRRDRFDRYSRWRSQDEYRQRPREFERDRGDFNRRSDRDYCFCYRRD